MLKVNQISLHPQSSCSSREIKELCVSIDIIVSTWCFVLNALTKTTTVVVVVALFHNSMAEPKSEH